MIKKMGTWGAIAFVVFFVSGQPKAASGMFKAVGNGVVTILKGFGTFISSLAS